MAAKRNRVRTDREVMENEPWRVANACLALMTRTAYTRLSAVQKVVHLARWYDLEVRNGGHLQYFVNSAGRRAALTVEALAKLGADENATILRQALARWESEPRAPIRSAEEFVSAATTEEFAFLDKRYDGLGTSLLARIVAYITRHTDDFVELVGEGEA